MFGSYGLLSDFYLETHGRSSSSSALPHTKRILLTLNTYKHTYAQ